MDPDFQLRGGSHPDPEMGGADSKKFFLAFWPSVWSKYEGRWPPLDPPLCWMWRPFEGQEKRGMIRAYTCMP